MEKRHNTFAGGSFVIAAALTFVLAGCGGNEDGSGIEDPLIQEGSNVNPSGTGPGVTPVQPESASFGPNPIDQPRPGRDSAGGVPPAVGDSMAP